ncbi:MAG: T9SS type A sorting domain-containing protein, partial [Bacteroidales bacterium]|nr:T9SS type A sorting domain-containing protein [Bacteroidales bacterium]
SIVSGLTNTTGNPSSPRYYEFSCAVHGSPGESEERCISFIDEAEDKDPVLEAYPNPLMDYSIIDFVIQEEGYTSLIVYDMYGRVLDRLVDENLVPGHYTIRWEPELSLKGMYLVELRSNHVKESIRMIKD